MATTSSLQKAIKLLAEASSPDSKMQALTSLRRIYLDDQTTVKTLKDEEFCELCNSIINASVANEDKVHIEACRTLDIILPETKNRNYDIFQSILQINRKKRLKILVSLSILKDETLATISSKMSILDFLHNCLESIQPSLMSWLLPENADNFGLLKNAENKTLNEDEEFEEKVVDRVLQLLCRLCSLSANGLNIRQFDTFIMDKVMLLAYMGHRRQRAQAVIVLQQAAKNDIGMRIRSIQREIWDKYKTALQTTYCKRMTLLVNHSEPDWAPLWESSITLIGTDLHRGSGLVNSLLKVEELAFKSADPNRRQAFLSWKLLIDNFALDQRELSTSRRIKLLCVPLNAKNSKTELMVLTKLEVWWHLIHKVYASIAECAETVLVPFLNICFGPFSDKGPLMQKSDNNISLGRKYTKTQVFAIDAFMQLLLSPDEYMQISLSTVQELLPNSVNSAVFEKNYKIFIQSFGEIIFILTLLTENDVKNRLQICKSLWNSLIKRIEEYDRMKISMYREITNVLSKLIKHRFHKIAMIRDFFLNVVLKDFDGIACSVQLTEHTLMELIQVYLQINNFSLFTTEHFQPLQTLLWHLIKPTHADVYYPQTLELMQTILKILEEAKKNNSYMSAVCEMWCILARVAKKYIEDSQNINEGTPLEHNFNTVESIIVFPFTSIFIDDQNQLKVMAETWRDLYKQFDFQAELIVTVKPNEILFKTSKIIMQSLKKDKRCCDFASICFDGLLSTVNYDNLPSGSEIPAFLQLLRDLTFQCLHNNNSFYAEKMLKALSSFLLRVFSHSIEKTAQYLKFVQPVVIYILTKVDDHNLEREIASTWSTIVGLFKKLQKSLDSVLLYTYHRTIVAAMLHLNVDISSTAFSILDLKDSVDEKCKKALEGIINELEQVSVKNNVDLIEIKEKTNKAKNMHIKPVGSFLNRKTMSPSSTTVITPNGKENMQKSKVVNIEPDSQDFVVINSDVKFDVNRLTEHQKELLKKRRDDIPAMYNELSVSNSQDTQELQRWFDVKSGKSPAKIETPSNNNEVPKMTQSPSLHFKNITETLTNEQQKIIENSVVPAAAASPKIQPAKEMQDVDVSTIENSQKKGKDESAPNVAKKLDFESHEEFPSEADQISPSIIDSAKMRRRNSGEESTSTGSEQVPRVTRRSMQPRENTVLRRSFSTEQITKRGRKRRNSENNSEGSLSIEREKRPRRDVTPEITDKSAENAKSSESGKASDVNSKISKRQLNEMTRLKIDMRFEPLPRRRSVSKSDTTEKRGSSEKLKDDKDTEIASTKADNNSQQQNNITRRRASRAFAPPKIDEKKDSPTKKSDKSEPTNKLGSRRSLSVKSEPVKKKAVISDDTQEEINIEDVSTQQECAEIINDSSPTQESTLENEKSAIAEEKSSQDSDIIESSQEPSCNSNKLDKVECFIKIKKVEVTQLPLKSSEDESEKDENVADVTADLDEIPPTVTSTTADTEKTTVPQPENKKVENNSVKAPIPASHMSSPKSTNARIFRSRAFPLQGRAAQMLGLVTRQSLAEKLGSESGNAEEITLLQRKEKIVDRVSSPNAGSRQEKIFNSMNNMNSGLRPERCASPAMTMFCNLKNDGERISPKLDRDSEAVVERENVDDSPPGKNRKELPLLEWSNANPPSLTASPSASILKKLQEMDGDTPNRKKRVSFADPPVSREMGYEIMTDSSSPPRLEKLPSTRSPISRKDWKRQSKLRLVQLNVEQLEKENDEIVEEDKAAPVLELAPKVKLATVISEISLEEAKLMETDEPPKTSTQNDSSLKLDSINLSNIGPKSDTINLSSSAPKSDNQQSMLEDTVDVNNISSSLNSTSSLSDKPAVSNSQQSGNEQGDTLPVTDSVFSNLPLSQETQSSEAQLNDAENLDSTLPVYPSLISCAEAVESVSADLVDPLFSNHLAKHLMTKSIRSVGDLAQLTERDVNRLPIKSPKLSRIRHVLSRYQQSLGVQTPERPPSSVVSSSTPLGKKTEESDSFEDLLKSSDHGSDLVSINVSAVYECKRVNKRHSTDTAAQTSPMKRPKKSDEEACTELMDQCDDAFLFNAFINRFKPERILKGYREKMNDKSEKEFKKETLEMLGLSVEDDSEASFQSSTKTVGLQKVLEQLPKIFEADDEFFDAVLKTYKKKLKPDRVFEILKPSELKDAIVEKFNSTELLNILAKKLSQEKEDSNDTIPNTSNLRLLLDKVSPDAIIEQVRTKGELKSSETLLTILLDQSSQHISDSVKRIIFKALTDNLDVCELADMYNEAIKTGVRKIQGK